MSGICSAHQGHDPDCRLCNVTSNYAGNFEEVYTQFMDKLHAKDDCPDATGNREKQVKQWLYEMCTNFKT